jgi:hypothetical protein
MGPLNATLAKFFASAKYFVKFFFFFFFFLCIRAQAEGLDSDGDAVAGDLFP